MIISQLKICIVLSIIVIFFSVTAEACVYKSIAADGTVYYHEGEQPREGYKLVFDSGGCKHYDKKKWDKYSKRVASIIKVQQFLYIIGYDPGPIDGDLGKKTIQAIEYFKKENKLPIDKKITNDLLLKLKEKVVYYNEIDKNNIVNIGSKYLNPKLLYNKTKLHKNDFEKNRDFEIRLKQKLKDETIGDIFISDVTNSLRNLKYNTQDEVWEFKLGEEHKYSYILFDQVNDVEMVIEKRSNSVGVGINDIKSAIGDKYGSFIKIDNNMLNIGLLKTLYTGVAMPMDIKMAKNYGIKPPFKFLIAFRFIKNISTDFHLEVSQTHSPTFDIPALVDIDKHYIRIHALALMVIDQNNKILNFRDLNIVK